MENPLKNPIAWKLNGLGLERTPKIRLDRIVQNIMHIKFVRIIIVTEILSKVENSN